EAGNKSCCAQPRAARIAGLRTAPLPAQSSPASQHSGDGGLPGKKIALDLQLPDLPVQIVDHLLRIRDRRCLAAARKQLARTLHQLLLPVADHRRMNPKFYRQLRQGLLPRSRRSGRWVWQEKADIVSLKPVPFKSVVEVWKLSNENSKSKRDYAGAMEKLALFVGHDDAARVTSKDIKD